MNRRFTEGWGEGGGSESFCELLAPLTRTSLLCKFTAFITALTLRPLPRCGRGNYPKGAFHEHNF
jgi:hypothetical protein